MSSLCRICQENAQFCIHHCPASCSSQETTDHSNKRILEPRHSYRTNQLPALMLLHCCCSLKAARLAPARDSVRISRTQAARTDMRQLHQDVAMQCPSQRQRPSEEYVALVSQIHGLQGQKRYLGVICLALSCGGRSGLHVRATGLLLRCCLLLCRFLLLQLPAASEARPLISTLCTCHAATRQRKHMWLPGMHGSLRDV